jgi:hypothetical protein
MPTDKELNDIYVGVQRLLAPNKTNEARLMLAAGMLVSSTALLTTLEDWQKWGAMAKNVLYTFATLEPKEDPYA